MVSKGKKYLRIGEISKLIGIEPHVLRYWEREFRQIRPHRVARQRLYRSEDVEVIRRVKTLLHDEGFTIAGARKRLEEEAENRRKTMPDSCRGSNRSESGLLTEIHQELVAIREMLSHAGNG